MEASLSNVRLAAGQQRALELIATGAPLQDVLDQIVLTMEEQAPGMHASIVFLVDGRVVHASAPGLPDPYCDAIDGEPVGPTAGSCGTAMYEDRRVIVSDIASDPLWADYKHVALAFGLRACWSTPIHSSTGKVLGSFAMYYETAREPSPDELALADLATHLAGIAIEHDHTTGQLRESEQRYRLMVETANEGVWAVDADERTTFVNARMAALLGYEPHEMIGRPLSDFMDADQWAAVAPKGEERRRGEREQYDLMFRRRDGEELWAIVSASPIQEADGTYAGAFALLTDITERRRALDEQARLEAQLRQAQKMEAVGRLAGGMAHDFNNLLTAIGGYSEILLGGLPEGHPLRSDAEEVRRAVDRAAALTRRLLVFSRRASVQRMTLDLNRVVADMDSLLRRLIGADVELVTVCDPEPTLIEGDPAELEQVVVNLALNARDAMPTGGKLVIETGRLVEAEERWVTLSVSDSGSGMDEETRARIFDPFFTTKEVGRGTGLGLSIVFRVVQDVDGRISVDSEPGGGTTFEIRFPAREGLAAGAPEPPSERGAFAPGTTILLVEDEDVLRGLASRVLRYHGCDVIEAVYASDALRLWRERGSEVDLVLTDIVMPDMNGVELARQLIAERPDIKVMLTSGFVDPDVLRQVPEANRVGFLAKPFTPSQLFDAVSAALAVR